MNIYKIAYMASLLASRLHQHQSQLRRKPVT
jgi:hypothetical protein